MKRPRDTRQSLPRTRTAFALRSDERHGHVRFLRTEPAASVPRVRRSARRIPRQRRAVCAPGVDAGRAFPQDGSPRRRTVALGRRPREARAPRAVLFRHLVPALPLLVYLHRILRRRCLARERLGRAHDHRRQRHPGRLRRARLAPMLGMRRRVALSRYLSSHRLPIVQAAYSARGHHLTAWQTMQPCLHREMLHDASFDSYWEYKKTSRRAVSDE